MNMRRASIVVLLTSLLLPLGSFAYGVESPIILHPTDDTWIFNSSPGAGMGLHDSLQVMSHGPDPHIFSQKALVKFDLSDLPPGTTISSATLYLYYYHGNPESECRYEELRLRRITCFWEEDWATWDTVGSCYDFSITDAARMQTCYGWLDWNVTADVQAMIDGMESNHGWMVSDERTGDDHPVIRFWARESGHKIPFLEIVLESEEWPMYLHDASNRAYNNSNMPDTAEVIWDNYVGPGFDCSPAVVDGKVYIGSTDMLCYDALGDGEGSSDQIWHYYIGPSHNIYSSPAVVDGKVYFGVETGEIYCLDAAGNGDGTTDLIWSYMTGDRIRSSPVVTDGKVYIGSWDRNVYCLDAEGNGDLTTDLVWSYSTGSVISCSPAFSNGRIYIGSNDDIVYCLDAEGNGDETTDLIWSFATGDDVMSSPTVFSGHVYVGSNDDNLYCLDAEGNGDGTTDLIWSAIVGSIQKSSPAIAYGRVYIGSFGSGIKCFDALGNCDGTTDLIWTHILGGRVYSPVLADGKVYAGSGDGVLSCLDAEGNGDGTTDLLWDHTTSDDIQTSPAIARGRIYIGSTNHHLYCLGTLPPPSIVQSSVEPWDSYGLAFVCPGTGTSCDSVTVTIRDENGDPCPYYDVEIDLSDCTGLCIDIPDGLSGTTDRDGVVRLDPRVGGCAECDVIVRAMDTDIRIYSKVTSSDWDGNWADGKVETVDSLYFMSQFMQPFPELCADYDGSGYVDLVDLSMLACCMGTSNAETCSLFYDCEIVPCSIDFETLVIGTTFDTTFVIRNTGSASLCDTVSLSCDGFSLVSGGGLYYLPSGDSLEVTVRFEPVDTGTNVCTIETGDSRCCDVLCTGVAVNPCVVESTTIDFGMVNAGCHIDTTFTIINNQDEALSGTVSESCPCDTILSGGGPYTLAPGETLRVTVRFQPTIPGTHTCLIETGDPLCCDVQCTGWTPFYTSTDHVDFGEVELGKSRDLSFMIDNHHCSDSLTGSVHELFAYDDFSILSSGHFNLAPGESKKVTVRFEPSSLEKRICVIDMNNEQIRDVVCSGTGKYVSRGSKTLFFLEQNDPNPFNPITEIRYNLPRDARVRLDIFNILGQKVVTLVNEHQSAGFKTISWNGKNDRETDVSSGVYFCRIRAGDYTETRKMILLR
ncbi:MAG: PQQ-binding-like beta-propeller repeat protein [Bacteroidales bacterium]|nr:PQQ-binding-like beta-propeller repeat protein [Candidatus Latescibacterota bacterium]